MLKEDGIYVKDSLVHIAEYAAYGRHFAKAVEFLQRSDLRRLPIGRYALDGDNVFAMVQESMLKPWGSARAEVHHDYFDIQVPLSGREVIGVGASDPATPGDFDTVKDVGFYDSATVEPLEVHPGEFVILHPETCAHAPCCTDDVPSMIRKIVVKVRK